MSSQAPVPAPAPSSPVPAPAPAGPVRLAWSDTVAGLLTPGVVTTILGAVLATVAALSGRFDQQTSHDLLFLALGLLGATGVGRTSAAASMLFRGPGA